jgi:hypothetical protein
MDRQQEGGPRMTGRTQGQGAESSNGLAPRSADMFVAVEQQAQALANYVREKAQDQPFLTVAVGAAAGYVLGGGLTLRLTRFVLTNAGRAVAGNLVAATIRGARPSWRTP